MRIDKRLAWITGLALVLVLVGALAPMGLASEELCMPLENIDIEAPAGVRAMRSAVVFPHGLHFDFACKDCHHKWTGTADNINCSTAGCHDLTAEPEKGSGIPGYRYFKMAYHNACIGCHKRIKAANRAAELAKTVATVQQPAGPTGCVECHSR